MTIRPVLRLASLLALLFVLLSPATAAPLDEQPILAWLDPSGQANIEQVARLAPGNFQPVPMGSPLDTRSHNAYWLRLDLQGGGALPDAWSLTFPRPYLDLITLYVQDEEGHWTSSRSGDTVPVEAWARPGHFPQFDLDLRGKTRQRIFLRIQNFKSMALQFSLEPRSEREASLKREYLWIGILGGALLIFTLWSAIQYFSFRDRIDGWYTFYTACMTVYIVNSSGMAAEFFWSDSPWWTDHAYSLFSVVAIGLTILCVRHLAMLSARYPYFDRFLLVYSACALASVSLHWLAAREVVNAATYVFFSTAPFIALIAMYLAWRRQNPIALWLLATYLPQGCAMLIVLLQENGYLAIAHNLMFVLLTAVAISIPLFLHGQDLITRDLKQIADRISHVQTQDALTGLLNEAAFELQMKSALYRSFHNREHAAVVLVEISNFDHVLNITSPPFADQFLLRGVIKIHRVMKDVDTAGRLAQARFGLIFEGIYTRQPLMERLITLVASGLVPVPGTRPELTFRFRVAVAMLSEGLYEPSLMLERLQELIDTMPPRTNRPIRFLDGSTPPTLPLEEDTGSDAGGPYRVGP